MSRWRVRYRPGRDSWTNIWGETTEFEQRPWLVEKIGRGGKPRRFDVWTEALAHADRMARTVEVVLPRVDGIAKIPAANGHPIDYRLRPKGSDGYYSAVHLSGAWGDMGIFHENDIEPIALTLLALARRKEQT